MTGVSAAARACHKLGQNSLLSTVKTMLNSPVIREKTQRLEVIQGGPRSSPVSFYRTPNDPNPACGARDLTGWVRNSLLSTVKTTLNSEVILEKTHQLEVIQVHGPRSSPTSEFFHTRSRSSTPNDPNPAGSQAGSGIQSSTQSKQCYMISWVIREKKQRLGAVRGVHGIHQ